MKLTAAAVAALVMLAMGAALAEAQSATISPSTQSGTEEETISFEIDGDWKHNAWIKYRVVDGTAKAGVDFGGDSGDVCHIGPGQVLSEYCEGGGQPAPLTAYVAHYWDDDEDGDKSYTVEAWVHRYETGSVDSDGMPIWSEPCASETCGLATATGTIIDSYEEEPTTAGVVGFTSDATTVEEGNNTTITIRFVPNASPHEAGTVRWETVANSAGGDDYSATSGTFSIQACSSTSGCGNQEQSVTVRTLQDQVVEDNDENFSVDLVDPDGIELAPANGLTAWHVITIRDDDQPNAGPSVQVSTSETSVVAGGTTQLTATASDSNGTIASYSWSGAGTFTDAAAATTAWTAPSPASATEYTLRATVTDNDGAQASATTTVSVAARTDTTPATAAGVVSFTSSTTRIASEGDSASVAIVFAPTKSPHQAGSVQWRTRPGTADAGDYETASGTFSIKSCTASVGCPGQVHGITIRTRDDSVHEAVDEDFTLQLHAGSEVQIRDEWHTVTIVGPSDVPEPEALPVVSIDGGTVVEGETARFRLTLDKTGGSGATVRYRTTVQGEGTSPGHAGGRHDQCRDYSPTQGTLNLGGQTSATVAIRTLVDGCLEGADQVIERERQSELIYLELYDPVDVTLERDTASFHILDVRSSFEIEDPDELEVAEGDTVRLAVVRTGVTEHGDAAIHRMPVDVTFEAGVTRNAERPYATPGSDYELPGPVRFGADEHRKTISVRTLTDTAVEDPDEWFSIALADAVIETASGKGALGDTTGSTSGIRIKDATETPREIRVAVRAVTPRVDEGETAICEVSVSEIEGRLLDQSLRVRLYTQAPSNGAVDGTDFTGKNEWLSFTRSETQTRQVRIPTHRTQRNQPDLPFACAIGLDASAEGDYDYAGNYALTIVENAAILAIENVNASNQAGRSAVWAYDQVVAEGGSATITMRLNQELNGRSITVSWRAESSGTSTASAGVDYTERSGQHTFVDGGATTFQISVPTRCDSEAEDDEDFRITASGRWSDNTQAGEASTIAVTIRSEYGRCGSTPGVVSIEDGSAVEGDDVQFTVSLARSFTSAFTVDYGTSDQTARAGQDYESTSGTLTIVMGSTSGTIRVPTLADDRRDEGETFRMRLSNARAGDERRELADDDATGTIIDTLPIGAEFRGVPREHDGTAFTFELHTTAAIDTATDPATALTVSGGTMTVEKRSATRWRLTITPSIDTNVVVGLDHTAVRGADNRSVSPVDAVTIFGRATVSISNASGPESEQIMRFTVRLDHATGGVSVAYATADGTASAGRDYEAASGRVTFAEGVTEASIPVRIFRTTEREQDETFTVTLSEPHGRLVIHADNGVATGTISDDSLGVEFIPPENARTDDSNFNVGLRFRPAFEASAVDAAKTAIATELGVVNGAVAADGVTAAGDNRNFTVTIDPDGHLDVELRLARNADIAGRKMQYDARARIRGVDTLSVSDAEGPESDADNARVLQFSVNLNQWVGHDVTVDYETEDGTALTGSDYTAVSGTLTFTEAGALTVDVPIIADNLNEGDETLKLKLTNASGATIIDDEGIGTITNHGALPMSLISRFGRAAGSHIVELVERRIDAPPQRTGFDIQLGGGWITGRGGTRGMPGGGAQVGPAGNLTNGTAPGMQADGPATRFWNGRGAGLGNDPLEDASLAMNRQARGGTFSIWSQSSRSSFTGREGRIALGGGVRTRSVGADYSKGRTTAGVALARSLGAGTYEGTSSGEVTSTLTGLYPWIGYRASERVTVWGVAGHGRGGLILSTPAGVQESPVSMTMTAAGTRARLSRGTGLDFVVKADALWVGTTVAGSTGRHGNLAAARAGVTRVRTGIEGSRSYRLMGRLRLQPVIEIGLRRDGGDAENGAGVDFGGGLVFVDAVSGFAVDMRWRTMVVHQAEQFSERGLAITFSYDPTSTPHGLRARIAPAWGGNAMGGANTLWRGEVMSGVAYGDRGGRLEGEVGYGLPVGRFVGTPRIGFSTASHGSIYRVGYGLAAAEAGDLRFELAVDAQRSAGVHRPGANHGGMGRTTVSW